MDDIQVLIDENVSLLRELVDTQALLIEMLLDKNDELEDELDIMDEIFDDE